MPTVYILSTVFLQLTVCSLILSEDSVSSLHLKDSSSPSSNSSVTPSCLLPLHRTPVQEQECSHQRSGDLGPGTALSAYCCADVGTNSW